MKTAWIYARRRGDDAELQRQIDKTKDFACAKEYRIAGVSTDDWDDWLWHRPGLQEMLTAVRTGKVNAVFVSRLTAISHRNRTLRKVLKALQKYQVSLITTNEQLSYSLAVRGLERSSLD